MSGHTPVHGIPLPVGEEGTGRFGSPAANIAYLTGMVEEYKKSTPTYRELRDEVTGAAGRVSASMAALATKEEVERIRPPSFWKLASGAAGVFIVVAGIIWQASARVSDIATQNALLQRDVSDLREGLKRLEATEAATTSKLDQLLLRGGKP